MILTDKQQEGLDIAIARYNAREPYTVLAGFAGTGKSTLVKHIIAALDVDESRDVVYCAYTGKATLVLSSKGCKNTSTLHKLLYTARLNPFTGKYSFQPRTVLEHRYKVIVVDEISMLSREMWNLLVRHKVYVLGLGDPGQLGPIRAADDSGLLDNPHIFLTEIMRQAEDNEIIKLSMEIREGKGLAPYQGENVQIIPKRDVVTGMLTWADQVLCATNAQREALNRQMREIMGFSGDPQEGDKVICLRNYWDDLSDETDVPLVNGAIGTIVECEKSFNSRLGINILDMTFRSELDHLYHNLRVDYDLMMTGKSSFSKEDYVRLVRNESTRGLLPKEFAFGYAITTWKAQGSEWDNVLLFEERFPWIVEDKKRYLYTGVTRASEKLVVVTNS